VTVAAIVPAAGRGERLGPGVPKALRPVGGVPMLAHAVQALARAHAVGLVVVVAPPAEVTSVRALLESYDVPAQICVVAGGDSRQLSVARALDSLPPDVDVVLVHDAARPFAPSELVDSVAAAVLAGSPAVVPALPVTDTVKRVGPDGRVVETVDRIALRAVQTPQGFARDVLTAAHAAVLPGSDPVTDDAGLVERLGRPVTVVPGDPEAFKVTRPLDLVFAQALLDLRRSSGAG
jgi:2-C-methyl-D-erythritol 4-phosphate cytidylyltransferase